MQISLKTATVNFFLFRIGAILYFFRYTKKCKFIYVPQVVFAFLIYQVISMKICFWYNIARLPDLDPLAASKIIRKLFWIKIIFHLQTPEPLEWDQFVLIVLWQFFIGKHFFYRNHFIFGNCGNLLYLMQQNVVCKKHFSIAVLRRICTKCVPNGSKSVLLRFGKCKVWVWRVEMNGL